MRYITLSSAIRSMCARRSATIVDRSCARTECALTTSGRSNAPIDGRSSSAPTTTTMTETFRPGAHVGVAARRPRAFSTLRRTLVAAEEIGLREVLVRAMDERAGGFFRRYGFQSATDER